MQRQNKKNTLKSYAILLLATLMLSNCSNRKGIDVDDSIRDPSAENDSLIQVNPMIPEAVRMLLLESDELLSQGKGPQAIMTLKRALSISPNSALVQQHLAEVHLAEADYPSALYWSSLVVNQGPDQGELCERSRRTQALAAELMGQVDIQARALESLISCSTKKPASF